MVCKDCELFDFVWVEDDDFIFLAYKTPGDYEWDPKPRFFRAELGNDSYLFLRRVPNKLEKWFGYAYPFSLHHPDHAPCGLIELKSINVQDAQKEFCDIMLNSILDGKWKPIEEENRVRVLIETHLRNRFKTENPQMTDKSIGNVYITCIKL